MWEAKRGNSTKHEPADVLIVKGREGGLTGFAR